MSQTIHLGDTGETLVNKFNYNASLIDNNTKNINNLIDLVQQHQDQINAIPKKDIYIKDYSAESFIHSSTLTNSRYDYNCFLDTTPMLWNFYIVGNSGEKEYIKLDSAYYLYPDGLSGIGISFNCDSKNLPEKLYLEVISYE